MNTKLTVFTRVLLIAITLSFTLVSAEAANKPIIINFKKGLTSDSTILAVGQNGKTKSVDGASKTSLSSADKLNRIYVLSGNEVSAAITAPTCSVNKKSKKFSCKFTKNVANVLFKAGCNLKSLGKQSGAFVAKFSSLKDYKACVSTASTVAVNSKGVPLGIASHGLASKASSASFVKIKADALDSDGDGLIGNLDSDDDGDGVLDNYEKGAASSPTSPGTIATSFKMFSNLKLDIDVSLNQHSTGLTSAKIDQAISGVQTLAIAVAGTSSDTTELDCGSLGYCSAGGTGKTVDGNQDFPGTAGGSLDADADGLGTITAGGTGDFQLKTGANSSTISSGDTYIQKVTDSSGVLTEVPGLLNFVFNSTPAIKTVAVNSNAAETVNYSATPILGSRNNCFTAPASGNVSLSLVGWRPQRAGDSALGEADFVDIGNSLITIDIPNGPGVTGAPSSAGPGNCVATAYSTTDSNLSISGDTLVDAKTDQDADAANTYSFNVDLTACLNGARSGAISWNSGQTLFVDLQFKSSFGDNAAQKFCVTRAAS